MREGSIFSRFLAHLDVPHTRAWSDAQFRGMTFRSLYGLSHLLQEYGVRNEGVKFTEKSGIAVLETPFLAQLKDGIFVIVTQIDQKNGRISYDSVGRTFSMPLQAFLEAWNGIALLAFPDQNSREPDYAAHHLAEMTRRLSRKLLLGSALILFIHFFVSRGLYCHISTIFLTLFNCVGLYFSFLLVQKSLNIHSAASEHVCGVLEHGGCDTIIKLKVSKLLGVFSWSEIGFAYFGVSLGALLLFPHMWPNLAICNLCCLPYTLWSIWYQKFRARHWCTLCVGVQSTLWLLFFCYLGGGWLQAAFPSDIGLAYLICAYIFMVLFINLLLGIFKNLPCHEKDS